MSAGLTPEEMCELQADLRALQEDLTAQVAASKEDAHRGAAEIRLRLVVASLTSLQMDEYGFCEECEEPIGFARLKAKPESRYCNSCQGARESRHPH